MADITITDGFLIAATLAGPVLAVQVQKFIERATEKHRQKLYIFAALMNTRATRLANEHVQALNMIELVFSAAKAAEKAVIDAWRLYADKLNEGPSEETEGAIKAWTARCDDLFVELMYALSRALRYKFDRVQLKRGIYYPRGHGEAEIAQRAIQQGLAKVLAGDRAIPMNVIGFPVSKDAIELQEKVNQSLLKALSGETAVRVAMEAANKGCDS